VRQPLRGSMPGWWAALWQRGAAQPPATGGEAANGEYTIVVRTGEDERMMLVLRLGPGGGRWRRSHTVINVIRLSPHNEELASPSVFDSLPSVCAGASGMSECVVCQEDFEPQQLLTQLPCKHAFCTPCISRWLLECKNECPLCASPITEENVQACTTSVEKDALSHESNFDLDNADAETPHAASLRGLDADGKRFSVSRRDGFGPGMSCCQGRRLPVKV